MLIVERPCLQWLSYSLVEIIASEVAPDWHIILSKLQQMSPVSLQNLPPARVDQARQSLLRDDRIRRLPVPIDDLVRVYFVLDTNSFPRGLCLSIAQCNHSCQPNARVVEYGTST